MTLFREITVLAAGPASERFRSAIGGFGVFAAFSRWLTARSERRTLVAAAIQHFEAAGQRAIHDMCAVIGNEARGAVVRVCHGDTRPPACLFDEITPAARPKVVLFVPGCDHFFTRPDHDQLLEGTCMRVYAGSYKAPAGAARCLSNQTPQPTGPA
jgi:hypothetical protein